jgi:hypothetical protein
MRICPLSTILVPNPSSAHEAKSTKAEITKQTTTPSANDPISNNNFPIKLQFLNFYLKEKPQPEKQIETREEGKGLREHMQKPTKSPGSLQSSRLSTT